MSKTGNYFIESFGEDIEREFLKDSLYLELQKIKEEEEYYEYERSGAKITIGESRRARKGERQGRVKLGRKRPRYLKYIKQRNELPF